MRTLPDELVLVVLAFVGRAHPLTLLDRRMWLVCRYRIVYRRLAGGNRAGVFSALATLAMLGHRVRIVGLRCPEPLSADGLRQLPGSFRLFAGAATRLNTLSLELDGPHAHALLPAVRGVLSAADRGLTALTALRLALCSAVAVPLGPLCARVCPGDGGGTEPSRYTTEAALHLAPLALPPHLAGRLRRLELRLPAYTLDDGEAQPLWDSLRRCAALHSLRLDLRLNAVSDAGLAGLAAAMARLPSLGAFALDVAHNPVSTGGVGAVVRALRGSGVRRLSLDASGAVVGDVALSDALRDWSDGASGPQRLTVCLSGRFLSEREAVALLRCAPPAALSVCIGGYRGLPFHALTTVVRAANRDPAAAYTVRVDYDGTLRIDRTPRSARTAAPHAVERLALCLPRACVPRVLTHTLVANAATLELVVRTKAAAPGNAATMFRALRRAFAPGVATRLRALHLALRGAQCGPGLAGVIRDIVAVCPALDVVWLDVSHNALGDDAVALLTAVFHRTPRIRRITLVLEHNGLSSVGLRYAAGLHGADRCVLLGLRGNAASDTAAAY